MAAEEDEEAYTNFLSILHEDFDPQEENYHKPSHIEDASVLPPYQDHCHHLATINTAIVTRQIPSHGLSFKLWPASFSFVSLLDGDTSQLHLPSRSPLRIIELGSGTGLVGIAAAAILGAHVTLTDLPHVLPNLQFNAVANAVVASARGGCLDVRQLRWGIVEDFIEISLMDDFDVIIASDVVYYQHLIDPLLETVQFFLKGDVRFLMAHLRRWKKRDAMFFRKARKLFDVIKVHADQPSAGSRLGVCIYRFTEKRKLPEPSNL